MTLQLGPQRCGKVGSGLRYAWFGIAFLTGSYHVGESEPGVLNQVPTLVNAQLEACLLRMKEKKYTVARVIVESLSLHAEMKI